MGGSTKTYDSTPSDIKGLRRDASSWLQQGGQGRASIPGGYGSAGVQPTGGVDLTGGPGSYWGSMPVLLGPESQPMPSSPAVMPTQSPGTGPATGPGVNAALPAPPPPGGPTEADIDPRLPNWLQDRLRQHIASRQPAAPADPNQFAGIYAGNPSLVNPEAGNVRYAGDSAGVTYGQAPDVQGAGRDAIRSLTDPNSAIWQMIMGFGDPRNNVNLGSVGTSSIDALGSETSGFFNNMKNQYQPYFTQARNEAVAAGKEGLGSLSGSSAANRLGSAVNRTLGQEQAMLAELAKWGIGQENARQLQLAGINTNRDITGAQINNQRGLSGRMRRS